MNHATPAARWSPWLLFSLVGIGLARLVSLGQMALTDNTESRYGSIAWEMFRSGDWVTPRVYIDGSLIPFWGKPPLEFWLTALSYKFFGVSEWAARLPSFLLGVAMVIATMFFARRLWGSRVAALAGIVLASAGLYFVLIGACVLDVPLSASICGAMIAFARFAEGTGRRRAWGVAFFLALAAGALAKGPITLVLVGAALGLWILVLGRWRLIIELPWFWGLAVFFGVAAPWYILAERATPGFLHYFFINEHFLRYVSDDYGDLYGYGRKRPFGAIWLMLLGAFLPWTLLMLNGVVRLFRGQKVLAFLRSEPWLLYVLLWGLAPALFFTMARQIVFTYLLPGIPGLAIATAVVLDRWLESDARSKLVQGLVGHLAVIGLIAAGGSITAVAYGGASVFLPAIVLFVLVILGYLAVVSFRREGIAALAGMLGLATGATLAAAIVIGSSWANERQSVKVILAELYRDPAALEREIVMPCGETHSAVFYIEAIFHGQFRHGKPGGEELIAELLDHRDDAVTLFKRSDWDKLDPELTARLVPVAETTDWVACERRDQNSTR